jgi:hypothetical protein
MILTFEVSILDRKQRTKNKFSHISFMIAIVYTICNFDITSFLVVFCSFTDEFRILNLKSSLNKARLRKS